MGMKYEWRLCLHVQNLVNMMTFSVIKTLDFIFMELKSPFDEICSSTY
jgi:hypothetical protein